MMRYSSGVGLLGCFAMSCEKTFWFWQLPIIFIQLCIFNPDNFWKPVSMHVCIKVGIIVGFIYVQVIVFAGFIRIFV